MGPVNHPTFWIPFVLSDKFDSVTNFERVNTCGDVDVVGDQKGLAGVQLNNESLMPFSIEVVCEQSRNHAGVLNLDSALMPSESRFKDLILTGACLNRSRLQFCSVIALGDAKRHKRQYCDQFEERFHERK